MNYTTKLKDRFKHMPEISRIDKHRKIPKGIKKAGKTKAIQTASGKRKLENVIKHSKPGSVVRRPVRESHVITTDQ
jgi:WD repeat and SOF domain-containing protein 1